MSLLGRASRTGAWLPTWDLITTKNLEIRQRRGLMITRPAEQPDGPAGDAPAAGAVSPSHDGTSPAHAATVIVSRGVPDLLTGLP